MISLFLSLLLTTSDAGVFARPVQVSADRLEIFKKDSRALYSGHAKAVRDTLTMTCDTIEVRFSARNEVEQIIASGHVEAIDGDRQAWGDRAVFENATGVLTVTGNPHGKQGAREVEGEVVTFVTGSEQVTVTKARTRVQEPKDQRVTIDADELVMRSRDSEAVWTGHVRAVKASTLLLAPKLTATWGADGEITRIKAKGGVEVTDADRWARGREADYDVPRGVLVVTGNPQARQNGTRLRGTKVTFFTASEFLEVENATTIIEGGKKK